MIKRRYIKYTEWECFNSGMWRHIPLSEQDDLISEAYNFTKDYIIYGSAMFEVVSKWPNSMVNFLTNNSINKKAYIGHCAVQYKINIPESITRSAWGLLSDNQKYLANKQALFAYEFWKNKYLNESKNRKIHFDMGIQLLFQWDT